MVYLFVIILSAVGIVAVLLLRGLLHYRNVRRIVRTVSDGFLSAAGRQARLLPETPSSQQEKRGGGRDSAVDLHQVRTLLRDAEKCIAKKDAQGAERLLIQAMTLDPDTADVKAKLARLYLDTNREQKAEVLYRELVSSVPMPSLFANLGLACYRQQRYVEACHAYQNALNLDPGNPERSADLAKACMAAQQYDDASRLFEKSLERKPRDIENLRLLAQCYIQLDDRERAEATYRSLNRLDPRDEEVKRKLVELAAG